MESNEKATLLVTVTDDKVKVGLNGSFEDILLSICTTIKILATKYSNQEAYQKLIDASQDDEQPLTQEDVVNYLSARIMHEIIDEFDCLDTTILPTTSCNTETTDVGAKLNFSGFDSFTDTNKEDT